MEIHLETFFVTSLKMHIGGGVAGWIVFYLLSKYLISVFMPKTSFESVSWYW